MGYPHSITGNQWAAVGVRPGEPLRGSHQAQLPNPQTSMVQFLARIEPSCGLAVRFLGQEQIADLHGDQRPWP